MPDEKLVQAIAAEAKELEDVPKEPIKKFMLGGMQRCNQCGAIVPKSELEQGDRGRMACKNCRRNG